MNYTVKFVLNEPGRKGSVYLAETFTLPNTQNSNTCIKMNMPATGKKRSVPCGPIIGKCHCVLWVGIE